MSPTGSAEKLPEPRPHPATAEEMFERCRSAVERTAWKLARPSVREDVVQEAFLRLIRHFRECRSNPEAWASSIVVNLIRYGFREGNTARRRLGEKKDEDEERKVFFGEPRPASAELMALVDRAFFDLSPLQREALRILVVDEIPEQEAAARMRISWGSYRALIYRARRTLLARLRAHLKGSGLLGELERFARD